MKMRHGRGMSDPTYRSWRSMRARCLSFTHKSWGDYGGRGITICAEWNDFRNFLKDMGDRPEGTTLDRKNTNGNYTPTNCQWSGIDVQNNNKRSCVILTFSGRAQTSMQWARDLGISGELMRWRLSHGWSVEESVTLPPSLLRREIRATL